MAEILPTNRDHEIVEVIDGVHIISMSEEAVAELIARALLEGKEEEDEQTKDN